VCAHVTRQLRPPEHSHTHTPNRLVPATPNRPTTPSYPYPHSPHDAARQIRKRKMEVRRFMTKSAEVSMEEFHKLTYDIFSPDPKVRRLKGVEPSLRKLFLFRSV